MMTRKRIWKLILALLLIAGLALGGMTLYRMGFSHGAMSNFTLPEGTDAPLMPFSPAHYGRGFGPRAVFLGLFPLLCFSGFFFLLLMGGLGCMARKRAWRHHASPGSCPPYGAPPPWWGSGQPPGAEDQAETESDPPAPKTA